MQLNDIRFFITHANEGKQIYDMLTNLLLHSFVKTANNCCKSFLLTTAWTPYFLGEKRHKRLAWWHFLCCDLQSKLQPRQVAYSNKIANDSGKKKPKTFWKRSERGRRDAYVLAKSLGPIMHAFLTTNSFIFDWQLIIIQSFCLVMNPNCKCCSINPSVQGPNSRSAPQQLHFVTKLNNITWTLFILEFQSSLKG